MKDKKNLYNQILEIREEVEQAEKVKNCIEQLQEQEKLLSQVKRSINGKIKCPLLGEEESLNREKK